MNKNRAYGNFVKTGICPSTHPKAGSHIYNSIRIIIVKCRYYLHALSERAHWNAYTAKCNGVFPDFLTQNSQMRNNKMLEKYFDNRCIVVSRQRPKE